jgi:LysR family carnitine catabolism transcriptional activator
MIRKLEEAAGTRLFERDTRNVTLTPEGELFSEVARSLIAEFEAAFDDMADYVARRRGRVAIASLPSLAARALPAVIAQYRRLYPGVAVTLHDALSDQCLALLRQHKADLVLTAPGANFNEFESRVLGSDPFYLVCRRDHALARRRRLKAADLAGQESSISPNPRACASMSTSCCARSRPCIPDSKSNTWRRWPAWSNRAWA